MLFGSTTDGHVGAAKYVSLSVFFCRRTVDAISTRDQAKPGINLMEEIHERTFQTRFMPTQRSSFNSPPILHDQQFGAHIFLISSLISCTGGVGGGGNHSSGVSENPQPYNIAEAEVDYDSEIGSEAWNIPLVIFQLQLISQAISGS